MTGARHTTKVRMLIAFAKDQHSHSSITSCESQLPITLTQGFRVPFWPLHTNSAHTNKKNTHIHRNKQLLVLKQYKIQVVYLSTI